jgi:hypothetical protein
VPRLHLRELAEVVQTKQLAVYQCAGFRAGFFRVGT